MTALAALLAVAGFVAWRAASPPSRSIRVGYRHWPPYLRVEADGSPGGLMLAVFQEAARRSGLSLEPVHVAKGSISALRDHKVGLWPAAPLAGVEGLHVSQPWMHFAFALLSRASDPVFSEADLGGRRVAFARNPFVGTVLLNHLREATSVALPDRAQVVGALCAGEVDAAFIDVAVARDLLLKRPPACAGLPLNLSTLERIGVQVGVGALPEAAPWADRLRSAIGDMARDGTLTRLFRQHGLLSSLDTVLLHTIDEAERRSRWVLRGLLLAALLFMISSWLAWRLLLSHRAAMAAGAAKDALLVQISRSEEKHRTLISEMRDGYFTTDERGVLTFVNPALAKTCGYADPSGMTGRDASEYVGPESRELLAELFQQVIESGVVVAPPAEFPVLRVDGTRFFAELSATPILQDGKAVGVRGTLRDVTGRKLAEERLLQAHKMESVGRLAGGIAHDFNNLLTVITGYSHLLLARLPHGDPLETPLWEIQKAGERAAGLTQQLLAFSRKQILLPQVLDLNHALADMETLIRRLVGEDVEVLLLPASSRATVLADPHQLHQVILNLVANARDAMPRGGKLTLEVSRVTLDEAYCRTHPEACPGPHVMVAVSDTGVGMDAETRRNLFEPFYTTKDVGQGTGLGLATVHGIIVQTGGHVTVRSEPGQGTAFRIYLPAAEQEVVPAESPRAAPATAGDETILVVEDQAEVRHYVAAALRSFGYHVLEAAGGAEALRLCEQDAAPIHLLLTDAVMPLMSGRELASRFQALRPESRALYISGHTDNVIVHHGILNEGTHFLAKPFSPEELAAKIREVLGQPDGP